MNKARFLVTAMAMTVVAAVGIAVVQQQTASSPEPGISRTLARERAERISALVYDLTLRVPERRTDPIRGRLTTTFRLNDRGAPLAFDFAQPGERLISLRANGTPLATKVDNGHIVIPAAQLVEGNNSIEFEFLAGDEPLNRQDDLLYSLFVPARASLAFPCFDQPDLKARWRFAAEVPAAWTVVSNGREQGRVDTAGRANLLFEETRPIPPYLFAFAAGRFSVETTERAGRTLRMFHRETDRARIDRNVAAIFDLHERALGWMEQYTGIDYPFPKFDFVLIPSFQFGGMEHPGAIFYNANPLLLDPSATPIEELNRANVIAHETAHMWFGDLVTMTWFDDVWMKEVFANFMAAKIVNPSFPDMNHDLRFLVQHHPAAYDVDRTAGANPIRQTLNNLAEAGSLYGAIIYQKAPIVMRQLEMLMGEAELRAGLAEYLTVHAFDNADWPQLVERLDRRSPLDITAWSRAWIEEPGRPSITTTLDIVDGKVARLAFVQPGRADSGSVRAQRIRVLTSRGGSTRSLDVTLDGPVVEAPSATGMDAPDWVLPMAGGAGYGDFALDSRSLEALVGGSLPSLDAPLARGVAIVVLWESMLEGRAGAGPDRLFDLVLRELPGESNELVRQLLLDRLRTLFWRFTTPDRRVAAASRLEPILRAGLDRARTTSEKAAWFSAIRSVATSPELVGWLESVWARRILIPGLPLTETDEAELALELAVRGVPGAERILTVQSSRFENADRRARFVFIRPAVSAVPDERARFFESLRDVRNRSREAWVLDAARYLHHPLRANESRRFVVPALDMVWDLQRTGDIFFPKRWADATLSGYQDSSIANQIRDFLLALPADYPPRLRLVLQASADPVFRAARLIRP